ncbi:MAG: L,D-transpeptidase family protein [Pseudomonadota bacterium]
MNNFSLFSQLKQPALVLMGLGLGLTLSHGSFAQITGAASGLPQDLVVGSSAQDHLNSEKKEKSIEAGSIEDILQKGKVGQAKLVNGESLKEFYTSRAFKKAWVNSSLLSQLAPSHKQPEAIISILKNAWRHGLNHKRYHIETIETLLGENTLPFSTHNSKALDVLLSDAMVSYVQDLTGMRVNARAVELSPRYWRKPLNGFNALQQIADVSDAASALESFAPQGRLYKTLQNELETLYRAPISAEETPVKVSGILRPGQTKEAVLSLRTRLGYEANEADPAHFVYDDELAQSVMAFQSAHGLKPDGIIGQQTLAVINKTRDDRINQVLVNMERLRWLEQEKPDRYVVVNVPAAKLWAIEDGQIAFDMNVVVGRDERQTNIFHTEMTGVRFNPTWTVPPTIKEEDFLPELQNDPLYLVDRGIELVHQGSTIDPTTVDWTMVQSNDLHGIQMVQQPGQSNPLGRIRVFMANPYNIYLHDTNQRSYFIRANRALSSGCIRMEEAEKIAHFVMKNNKNWSEAKMQRILASGEKTDLGAEVPVPVYLLYQTIWFGDNGQLIYGHDIYSRDALLRNALHDIDGVGYPEMMTVSAPKIPDAPKKVTKPKRVNQASRVPGDIFKKARESSQVPQNQQTSSILGNINLKPKKKDGIDLLTFNE